MLSKCDHGIAFEMESSHFTICTHEGFSQITSSFHVEKGTRTAFIDMILDIGWA
jgi:hypothetical protein